MSIFGNFKKGKKLADQKKAELEKTKTAADNKPTEQYQHIPKHAARDAVYGAPSGWRTQDRESIKRINKNRTSMISRNSSYVSQGGLPRTQSYPSEAPGSQYHRSYSQQHMSGRNVRSTSYNADHSASRVSMPGRLETRHHSFQGRQGFSANGAYTGAAQPFAPSPLATTRKHKLFHSDWWAIAN